MRKQKIIREITAGQIDAYLDTLALLMTRQSPEFDWLMPLYERLENEKNAIAARADKISRIRQRAQNLKQHLQQRTGQNDGSFG